MKVKFIRFLQFALLLLAFTCIAIFFVGCNKEHTHTWDSGVVTSQATHTQEGVMTYTCTDCGETKTEAITKTSEHTYSDWQTYNETNHKRVCECGETEYETHTYSDWQTYSETNHKRVCECGETEYEAHTYSDWQTYSETNHKRVCECGEVENEAHSFDMGTCTVCGYVDESYIPDTSYFVGNVFQIVGLDLGKQPLVLGSGFVIDESGYFMTNSHVMEDAYYAYAIFEIPNTAEGESFTKLDITLGGYNNADKDIFVGKIENYSSISAYYNDIKIATSYTIGEVTYSVGYPGGTSYMQVNMGAVEEKDTFIYDKLNGIEYIVSTSYIASGSSGGILLNRNLEIIGMTSGGIESADGEFELGYSISALNFINCVNNAATYDYTNLARYLHAEYTEYIDFFEALSEDGVYSIDDSGIVYYTYYLSNEGTNSSGYSYSYRYGLMFGSDFSITSIYTINWSTGDECMASILGIWSPSIGFDNLYYLFTYEYSNGNYYDIYSININYSETISLTLLDYTVSCSTSYSVADSEITYAKEVFNTLYEILVSVWNYYNV